MNIKEHKINEGLEIVKKAKELEKNGCYDQAAKEYKKAKDFFKEIGQIKLSAQCLVAHVANMIKYCLGGRDFEEGLSFSQIDSNIKKLDGIDNIGLTNPEKYEIYMKAYRELEKIFHDINRIDKENELYYKRMSLYHKLHCEKFKQKNKNFKERLKYFSQYIFRGFLHHFYRHGERPDWALYWIFTVIMIFAAVYKAFDLISVKNTENIISIWQSFYFSFVTFTTLGYGEIVPTCLIGQFLATLEILLGLLTIALFIPLIIKKLE